MMIRALLTGMGLLFLLGVVCAGGVLLGIALAWGVNLPT